MKHPHVSKGFLENAEMIVSKPRESGWEKREGESLEDAQGPGTERLKNPKHGRKIRKKTRLEKKWAQGPGTFRGTKRTWQTTPTPKKKKNNPPHPQNKV